MSCLGMLLCELAVLLRGRGVLLRLFVFAQSVMVLSLMVVMTSRGLMMLRRRMFRQLSVLPCSESPLPESQSPC
jgi:hypothetical protein